jgi:hypothetical protein
MSSGLTNRPATFQTMMNEIFQDLITEGVVSVYLDDILIFTSSIEEHHHITRLVLDRMHEHKLYLQPEKCKFEKTRIEYLGVIISHNKVEMDPVKVTGVADWPTPTNKKEVQSFFGFINFYRRFISNFSHHARALFDLTMKDVRFIWGLPQEDSFTKLKELVTSSPVLVLPDDDLRFVSKLTALALLLEQFFPSSRAMTMPGTRLPSCQKHSIWSSETMRSTILRCLPSSEGSKSGDITLKELTTP